MKSESVEELPHSAETPDVIHLHLLRHTCNTRANLLWMPAWIITVCITCCRKSDLQPSNENTNCLKQMFRNGVRRQSDIEKYLTLILIKRLSSCAQLKSHRGDPNLECRGALLDSIIQKSRYRTS